MRTEQDLRISLNDLADQVAPTEALLGSITTRLNRKPRKRRNITLLVTMAVVVLIAAVVIPQIAGERTAGPADTRRPGNWNLTHRVDDMPEGWDVRLAYVQEDSERTEVGPPADSGADELGCEVQVFARGQVDPKVQAAGREPVTVQGRRGFYGKGRVGSLGGVTWPYAEDAWAAVVCLGRSGLVDRQRSIAIAEKVVFASTVSRLPFQLAALPPGYEVQSVLPGLPSGYEDMPVGVGLVAGGRDMVGISWEPGPTKARPGIPGWESATINGNLAVLSASDETLFLNVRGDTVRISGPGHEQTGPDRSVWPAGQRELLIEVAEKLSFAPDFEDQNTWFEANSTLPR